MTGTLAERDDEIACFRIVTGSEDTNASSAGELKLVALNFLDESRRHPGLLERVRSLRKEIDSMTYLSSGTVSRRLPFPAQTQHGLTVDEDRVRRTRRK